MPSKEEMKERLDKIFSLVGDVDPLKNVEMKDLSKWILEVDLILDEIHGLSWFFEDEKNVKL